MAYVGKGSPKSGKGGCESVKSEVDMSSDFYRVSPLRLLLIKVQISGSEVAFMVWNALDLSSSAEEVRAWWAEPEGGAKR